jgi:hypothetical protein
MLISFNILPPLDAPMMVPETLVTLTSDLASHLMSRNSAAPAPVANSRASNVPLLSRFAALKRCSTTARYSSLVNVLVVVGIGCGELLGAHPPASSRLSSVPP